ncbi:DUF5682 family protein [Myceligenerans xiligouense]|uniref:Uncharacterized protein n=1 Tax=Myceligenerans xiligouense TaxID=253184 RepID=A0A3N4YKW8_9MICO|nr:DUF5682 family protein [Myceligenerans xiligouense]RPF20727.1 hypothetical protein EDD34_1331 [Myceligenerans xiligouense]
MTSTATTHSPAAGSPAAGRCRVEVLGIRHHGPGSARSVVRALEAVRPDILLIEGPPEADDVAALAGDPGLVPPVALLAHAPTPKRGRAASGNEADRPGTTPEPQRPRAAFWPFAVFSPEWQALRWAAGNGVPVRFVDLPAAAHLALDLGDDTPLDGAEGREDSASDDDLRGDDPRDDPHGDDPHGDDPHHDPRADDPGDDGPREDVPGGDVPGVDGPGGDGPAPLHEDPLARLAAAAGYGDAERWWEDLVEHRTGDLAVFEAVAEAMAALREDETIRRRDALREAHMRMRLRAAIKDGAERIVVVCGAWHVPALTGKLPPAAQDTALLRPFLKELKDAGLAKATVTWVPWSHGRLATRTGYGAGVTSPGWYHHMFTAADRPVERWLTHAGNLLRDEGLPVSSAHLIEGVRLADTLAALRGRPATGLDEATEAIRSVLVDGDELRLALVRDRLEVGERLGEVPPEAPAGPLERDLAARTKTLRLPRQALAKQLDLDLRKPTDLERSRLLHQLTLLGVAWGRQVGTSGKGTFKEGWEVRWDPGLAVDLVAAGVHGTTVADAASGKVLHDAARTGLPGIARLVEGALLADLSAALPPLLDTLRDQAALGHDTDALLDAIPALARTLRYGDVRGTSPGSLGIVLTGLVTRARTALPAAVVALDDDAAAALVPRLREVSAAVSLLGRNDAVDAPRNGAAPSSGGAAAPLSGDDTAEGLRDEWLAGLARLADRDDLHGLVAGWIARTLRDEQAATPEQTQSRLSRFLSPGTPTRTAAAFVEGFVGSSGLVLVHDAALLALVDRWLSGLSDDAFVQVLPLLRRSFARFDAPERRAVGERIAGRDGLGERSAMPLHPERVARVRPVLATILEKK